MEILVLSKSFKGNSMISETSDLSGIKSGRKESYDKKELLKNYLAK